jgi:outer membrane receptor protein involved in Fe transport
VKQNHTIKFGWEWRLDQYPTLQITGTNGFYTFGGGTTQSALDGQTLSQGTTGFALADFLLGNVSAVSLAVPADFRTQKYQTALFAQDTWKVTRRLTLDYGLRWDYGTYSAEQYGRNANFDPNIPNASAAGHPGGAIFEATCGCKFSKNYPYAFGPRIGVAYQINSKTVLRAGFGIVYNRTSSNAGAATTTASGGSVGFGQWLFQLKDGIPANVRPQWPVFESNVGADEQFRGGGPRVARSQ